MCFSNPLFGGALTSQLAKRGDGNVAKAALGVIGSGVLNRKPKAAAIGAVRPTGLGG
jgi:hypothetical protein